MHLGIIGTWYANLSHFGQRSSLSHLDISVNLFWPPQIRLLVVVLSLDVHQIHQVGWKKMLLLSSRCIRLQSSPPSCLGKGQFLSISPDSSRNKGKIIISINYPAIFVYPLSLGTVCLPFKLLLSSIERSILSYKIYHCGITCRCSSRNVKSLSQETRDSQKNNFSS